MGIRCCTFNCNDGYCFYWVCITMGSEELLRNYSNYSYGYSCAKTWSRYIRMVWGGVILLKILRYDVSMLFIVFCTF